MPALIELITDRNITTKNSCRRILTRQPQTSPPPPPPPCSSTGTTEGELKVNLHFDSIHA